MWSRIALCAIALSAAPLAGQAANGNTQAKGSPVMQVARGTFDVKVKPAAADPADKGFGRYSLDKVFKGDIAGESRGVMLGTDTPVKGSMAYVALETVTGTVSGRKGSFSLMHNGTMQGKDMTLVVTVVPDSGTDELVGLAGTLRIVIAPDGTHNYEFEYTLP